jgi:putative ABC transport system substrate-binding protein
MALALALLAAPLAADAQPAKLYRIGFLTAGAPPPFGPPNPKAKTSLAEFQRGLLELGYVDGRDFLIEGRFADGKLDRLPALAAELVALGVDIIVANGGPSAKAAKDTTATIPIVFKFRGDPVERGLVASLARPGGNLTGVTESTGPEIAGKRLQLLKETVPRIARVAVLDASPADASVMRSAALNFGIALRFHSTRTLADLPAVLATIAQERADGLLVSGGVITEKHLGLILEFAARNRLATMWDDPDYVELGILMSYSTSGAGVGRRVAAFVDRILKGAKPADLPVERPTTFDLAVNLKTAKALGLTIPPSVLARADEVIQ